MTNSTAQNELRETFAKAPKLSCSIERDDKIETVEMDSGDLAYKTIERWIVTFDNGIVKEAKSRVGVDRILSNMADKIKGIIVSTEEQ